MKLALTPIVELLKAHGCKHAEGLLEFGAQTTTPATLPARFVVPTAESAQPNSLDGGRNQRVGCGISVFLVLEAARRRQAGVAEDLKVETDRLRDILVGWTHPEASGPFDYAGGRLASADGSAVVWELRVTAAYNLRKTS